MARERPQPYLADAPKGHRLPHCKACNYDLRGSPSQGYCPECGAVYNFHTGQGLARPKVSANTPYTWADRVKRYANTAFWLLLAVTFIWVYWLVDGYTQRTAIVAGSVGLIAVLYVATRITLITIEENEVKRSLPPPPDVVIPRGERTGPNPFDPTKEFSDGIEVEGMEPDASGETSIDLTPRDPSDDDTIDMDESDLLR